MVGQRGNKHKKHVKHAMFWGVWGEVDEVPNTKHTPIWTCFCVQGGWRCQWVGGASFEWAVVV